MSIFWSKISLKGSHPRSSSWSLRWRQKVDIRGAKAEGLSVMVEQAGEGAGDVVSQKREFELDHCGTGSPWRFWKTWGDVVRQMGNRVLDIQEFVPNFG